MAATTRFRTLRVLTRSLVGKVPIDRDLLELAFRVLVEAAHPDVADALTVQGVLLNPVCQEELFNPGRDVSINPIYNPILTPQRTVPGVRLGYASSGQSKIMRGSSCSSQEAKKPSKST